jgi:L-fuconolactonase
VIIDAHQHFWTADYPWLTGPLRRDYTIADLRPHLAATGVRRTVLFALDHLGKPPIADGGLDRWRRMIAPVARHDNVTAKLSGLVTEAGPAWTAADLRPYVEIAFDLFGPHRLMFGSDWPVCEPVATYEQVAAVLTAILGGRPAPVFGGTAARVYRLEPR